MKSLRSFYLTEGHFYKHVSASEAFPFLQDKEITKPIISFVGGGGKTTTMHFLAKTFHSQGKKVLITTTTHIEIPTLDYHDFCMNEFLDDTPVYAANIDEVKFLWEQNRIVVIGTKTKEKKLSIPEATFLKMAMTSADAILIEADGAKRLPCKVPIAKEPVILPECNIVIGIMGIDTLGKATAEICFRHEKAKELFGFESTHIMTSDDMVQILISDQGTRKSVNNRAFYIVINKCDTEEQLLAANTIAQKIISLPEKKVQQIIFSSHCDPRQQ